MKKLLITLLVLSILAVIVRFHQTHGFWLVAAISAFTLMAYGLSVLLKPDPLVSRAAAIRAYVCFGAGAVFGLADTAVMAFAI